MRPRITALLFHPPHASVNHHFHHDSPALTKPSQTSWVTPTWAPQPRSCCLLHRVYILHLPLLPFLSFPHPKLSKFPKQQATVRKLFQARPKSNPVLLLSLYVPPKEFRGKWHGHHVHVKKIRLWISHGTPGRE